MSDKMRQVAPYPYELGDLIEGFKHRPNWTFTLEDLDRGQGSAGLTFIVHITEPDSYDHSKMRSVVHYFPVPPAAYDRRSWQRWLLDRCMEVSRHEDCEHFTIYGEKPYAPSHGPGNDPYMIREVGTDEDRRTSFRGELNE